MATGIQGPQGFKGARGVQGATGWGAIGSDTGPTGPTGPIGYFQNQVMFAGTQGNSAITLDSSTISTLYRVTTNFEVALSLDSTLPTGGFHVFTNQTTSDCSFSATGPFAGGTIDAQQTLTLPTRTSVMLIRTGNAATNNQLSSAYPYSGLGSTGTVGGGGN